MLAQEQAVTFKRTVKAEPSEVFRAFTNRSALQDWLCNAAEVEARKGGRIYLWWNKGYHTAGVFTDLERDERLAFTWQGADDPAATEVRVELQASGESTTVSVAYQGVGSGPEWAETAERIKRIWEDGLENLQSMLEEGIDLRLARRPMFGLNGGDMLNPELATRLNVPIKEGFWLAGLVDGMGAQAAGLQKDDVVVNLAGQDITTFQSFTSALEKHKAGDRVPVVFYRGPERHEVTIELSRRPAPKLPATKEDLVRPLTEANTALHAELDALFEGVTEAEAGYKTAPTEWSAKDIMGHLISSTRDDHRWIAGVTSGDVDVSTIYNSNGNERVSSVAAVYSPLPLLVEELKRSDALTITLVAAMPEAAASRKHLFNPLANGMTNFPDHHREHYAEIKALIDAARS